MARPCGCAGECGCTIVGVDGIRTTGTGSTRDPYRVGLSTPLSGTGCDSVMDCVGGNLGAGMRYIAASHDIASKLSGDSGNAITLGSDNGLYAAVGGGGGTGDVTIASLPTAANSIIGGSYGAGYTQFPEGPDEAYRHATAMTQVNMIHVPVRRTFDRYLLAMHYRDLATYNYRYSGRRTDLINMQHAETLWLTPGGDPNLTPTTGDVSYPAQGGYFGFMWRDSRRGATLLSDVFEITQKRKVLYLECKDLGASVGDTPAGGTTLAQIQTLVRNFGIQKSVIVGSEMPVGASSGDNLSINNALVAMKTADAIEIAVQLPTQAAAAALTPATLVTAGYTWAMMHYSIAETNPATIASYKAAGLQVMLYGGHRQYHFNLATTVAVRGVLYTDPVYGAGATADFVRYHKTTATWDWSAPTYGRHAYGYEVDRARDKYRGYLTAANELSIDGATRGPHETDATRQSGYHILMGEQCPVNDTRVGFGLVGAPNFYDLEVGIVWDALVSDRYRYAGFFFAAPEDRPMLTGSVSTTTTLGFEFYLAQNGIFTYQRWNGTPGVPAAGEQWDSGWGTITPGVEYRIKVRVRPDRLIVGRADQAEGVGTTHTYTGLNGTQHRGPYFYLTRHFWTDADSTRVRFRSLILTEGTSV